MTVPHLTGDCCFLMAYTVITDIASFNKDNFTKAYGVVSACFSLGFIIGETSSQVISE